MSLKKLHKKYLGKHSQLFYSVTLKILSLLIMLIVVRESIINYGVDEYGEVSILYGFVGFLSLFDLGFGLQLRNESKIITDKIEKTIIIQLVRNIMLIFSICLVLGIFILDLFKASFFYWFLVSLIISLKQVDNIFIGSGNISKIFKLTLLYRILLLLSIIQQFGDLKMIWLLSELLISVSLIIIIIPKIHWNSKINVQGPRENNSFAFFILQIVGFLFYGSHSIIINEKLQSTRIVGEFDEVFKYCSSILIFVNIFNLYFWNKTDRKISISRVILIFSTIGIFMVGFFIGLKKIIFVSNIEASIILLNIIMVILTAQTKIFNSQLISLGKIKNLLISSICLVPLFATGIYFSNNLFEYSLTCCIIYFLYLIINLYEYNKAVNLSI